MIAPIRNKALHVFLYDISSSLLHTLHSSVRIDILGKWGQLFLGQSILNECIVNLCRCQALLVQFLKCLLEHIVTIHRCIKGLLCIAKVAQLINYHAAIRVVCSQTMLLGNRLTLAGRLVCVWPPAREKLIFECFLHIIEDFVLLVGALHRVFAHDVVNINRHVSLVVDHLLQGVHKTTNNVCGFYFKIAIRTVNVHILLPVKIERTLRVAQVINQLGVYRVCNILACVIAVITEEAKCQTGNISVLISQLHILHLGIANQRHHIVIITIKLLLVKNSSALIGILIRGTCKQRSILGVFQNLFVLHVVHAAVAFASCRVKQAHGRIHLLLGALRNVWVVHEICVSSLILRVSWGCLRCTVHLHESIHQILTRCRRNQLVLLVRSQPNIYGNRGAVGILSNHEITTAIMSKIIQRISDMSVILRLSSLKCAHHHHVFKPCAKGNVLIASDIVGNHHGSSLNAETCGGSTKLLCAMQPFLACALLQASDTEL